MGNLSLEDARKQAMEQARARVDHMSAQQRASYNAQFQRARERAEQIMTRQRHG